MSKTLIDLAHSLLERGVYVVLNAGIPRDIRTREMHQHYRHTEVVVPLACCNKAKTGINVGKRVVVTLGRDLESKRPLLNQYGFELVQITQEALELNYDGVIELIESLVLGISRTELLWMIFEGYAVTQIMAKTGLTRSQLKMRIKKYFGGTIRQVRQRKESPPVAVRGSLPISVDTQPTAVARL